MDEDRELPEERLAQRLSQAGGAWQQRAAAMLDELAAVDRAVYRAVAETPTPTLDEPLRRTTQLANYSKIWLGAAAAMFVLGGSRGRRAALTGVAAIAVTSAVVNLPMKFAGARARPDREGAGVPTTRWVEMPASGSFPSGHSASAFAFTNAVADIMPQVGGPLRAIASIVAFSRIHTGVHYPGDVIAGALVGGTIGELVAWAGRRIGRVKGSS
jgi:undecaprenyl-diphosphatase